MENVPYKAACTI